MRLLVLFARSPRTARGRFVQNHFNADDEDETYWRALSLPTGARHGLQLQVCGAQGLAKTDGSTKPICKVFFEGSGLTMKNA